MGKAKTAREIYTCLSITISGRISISNSPSPIPWVTDTDQRRLFLAVVAAGVVLAKFGCGYPPSEQNIAARCCSPGGCACILGLCIPSFLTTTEGLFVSNREGQAFRLRSRPRCRSLPHQFLPGTLPINTRLSKPSLASHCSSGQSSEVLKQAFAGPPERSTSRRLYSRLSWKAKNLSLLPFAAF